MAKRKKQMPRKKKVGRKTIYHTEEAKRKAMNKCRTAYQKRSMTAYTFRFHSENDKAIIERLNEVENKADYIRQLILADINK